MIATQVLSRLEGHNINKLLGADNTKHDTPHM